ncbi:galactitol-1-phosphate 5-dehydrogenase [Candidatus Poribacteria bacterium]|nr:MAG: galactitol-1-phosphate 5-dehydrogenase [Candidatus Poribacteria bacterium]
MEALVLHGIGDLRLEQVPVPHLADGEVRVRIGFCGVCGSDIPRIFVKGTYSFPTICGHEFAGIVDACGPAVEELSPGDPVAVFPLLWCGKCSACEQGKYVQCHDYDYLGSRSDGAFAEYVVAPQQNLIPIPQGVTLEEASMTEPAAVALHALRRVQTSLAGKTVAIFGAGPIGLMTAQWARIMGAAEIFLFDIVAEKLRLAKQLGFDKVFNTLVGEPVEIIETHTDGKGAHICVEAAGVPATYQHALGSAGRGGSVVFLGNPAADVTLPATLISQVMRREVSVFGTWNSDYSAAGNDDDWRTVLQAMASNMLTLAPLITHKVPLRDSSDMLHKMRDQREFYAKVLLHPSGEHFH